jgi:ribonuclease VapC
LIVDSSAVIAVLREEPEQVALAAKLHSAKTVAIGAPTLFEAGMVLVGRMGESGSASLIEFLERFKVEVIPFGDSHWRVALEAFVRFGKGRHRAALNLGDCMTYATALIEERPLLYVGNDFGRTDLAAA